MSGRKMLRRNKPIRIEAADSNRRLSIESFRPDIALVSATLPGRPSRSAHCPTPPKGSSEAIPRPRVLRLDQGEPHLVVAAFRVGARGAFSRSQPDLVLLGKCVRRVVEGQVWVDTLQMLYLLKAFTGNRK